MLEIPEANTIAHQLKDTVVGKKISRVEAAQSPHGFAWYFGDPAEYPARLEGRTIDDAYAHGGQVELSAGEMRISLNDGVNVRYLEPGAAPPKKHQLYIVFDDGSAIVCTIQMYGGMMVFPNGAQNDNFYYTVSWQKPSPLSDAFDRTYFDDIVAQTGPKASAKALLATEQRIPGLGNGCLHDILWNARVNPQSKLGKLSADNMTAIYDSIKATLADMTEKGGRDTEKNLFGQPGGYMTRLSSKTAAYACPVCGGPITRKAYMGGNVYFCEACQPVLR